MQITPTIASRQERVRARRNVEVLSLLYACGLEDSESSECDCKCVRGDVD
jgi:hypothetical protein